MGRCGAGNMKTHFADVFFFYPGEVCIVAIVILVMTVWLTCWTQEEEEKEQEFGVRKS